MATQPLLKPLTTAVRRAIDRSARALGLATFAAALASSGTQAGGAPATAQAADPVYRASSLSPFKDGCDQAPVHGTLNVNSEVEPYVAADPLHAGHLVGAWQQDRWSDGGARGLMAAASFDGGKTWKRSMLPFSRCAGGNAGNGGDYPRASDPWVSIGPDGTAYAISISYDDFSDSAVLASHSTDGGLTWSAPATLIKDGLDAFNDKESITADPILAGYVYAVWDRSAASADMQPEWFARSTDGGRSWKPARPIYQPGRGRYVLGSEITVLPDGTLVDLFTLEGWSAVSRHYTTQMVVLRSTDHGLTWSKPVKVADENPVGALDWDSFQFVRDGSYVPQMAAGPDGTLYVVWQEGVFSGYDHDGVALSRSTDGGRTWSSPVQINGDPSVEAYEPSVAVRPDGTVAVTYFDWRKNTSDPDTLPTSLWITRSKDLSTWNESAVAPPFDMENAPFAGWGLFVGDYQGLATLDGVSVAFFGRTNESTSNRSDIASAPEVSATALPPALQGARTVQARPAPKVAMTEKTRQRIDANVERTRHDEAEERQRRQAGQPGQD